MLKIMKKSGPPDDNRPAIAAADHILDMLLPSVFEIFRDKQFRKTIGFDQQSQTEQDRIFNELEIAAISLSLFCLDQRESIIGNKDFHFWKNVRTKLPEQFVEKLSGYGVEKKYTRLFGNLISMRHEEYRKIAEGSRDDLENDERFSGYKTTIAMDTLNRVQAITVGTADHIRRGKLEAGDKLMSVLRGWLFPLDMEINKFIKKL